MFGQLGIPETTETFFINGISVFLIVALFEYSANIEHNSWFPKLLFDVNDSDSSQTRRPSAPKCLPSKISAHVPVSGTQAHTNKDWHQTPSVKSLLRR